MYECPVCKAKTLDERGQYDICSQCFWEDGGSDEFNPNQVTISEARENFKKFGVCDKQHLRFKL